MNERPLIDPNRNVSELNMAFQHNPEIIKNMVIFFLVCAIFLSSFFLLYNFSVNAIAQFLNVNQPLNEPEVLVVEGWVPKRLLGYVNEEFTKGSYKYILISGMDNEYISDPDREQKIYSNASKVARELINMGIAAAKIKVATCSTTNIHRTFSMAIAIRKWLDLNDPKIRRVNIISAWSHGRKTWCAYQKIFGDTIQAGIFTYPKRQLPVSQWWLTRCGLKYQLYFLAGYVYVSLWPVSLLH